MGKVALVTSTNLTQIIPPRQTKKLNTPLQVCPESCLLGTSTVYHTDKINHHTGQHHALSPRIQYCPMAFLSPVCSSAMSSLAFLSSPFLQTVSCWTGFTWYSCSMIGYHVICLSNRTLLEKSGLRTVKVTEKRVKATLAGKHLETRRWPLVSGLKFNLFQCSCGSHLGTLALGSLLLALKILFSLSSSLD